MWDYLYRLLSYSFSQRMVLLVEHTCIVIEQEPGRLRVQGQVYLGTACMPHHGPH